MSQLVKRNQIATEELTVTTGIIISTLHCRLHDAVSRFGRPTVLWIEES